MQNVVCLSCNLCNSQPDGIVYKSTCSHVFCVSCARASFEKGSVCPICRTQLNYGDVVEVCLGLGATDGDGVASVESLCSMVLGSSLSWTDIARSLETLNSRLESVNRFFFHKQLLTQVLQRETEVLALRAQAQEAERKLEMRERDVAKLTAELSDATRKCTAWAKAYDNVRDQLLALRGPPSGGVVGGQPPGYGQQHQQQAQQAQQQQQQQQQAFQKLTRRTSEITTVHHGPVPVMEPNTDHLQQYHPQQQHQQPYQQPYQQPHQNQQQTYQQHQPPKQHQQQLPALPSHPIGHGQFHGQIGPGGRYVNSLSASFFDV